MQGNAPGMGFGPPPGNVPQAQPSPPHMQSAPVPQGVPYAPLPRRTSRLALSFAVIAVLLAGAALVVSLIRKPETQAPPNPTSTPTATVPAQQLFVEDADRALCEAIAPLMGEVGEQNKTFGSLAPGSPEQGAAIPGYRSFIEEWAGRIQAVLNTHADPSRYLTRTLQAYIDEKLLYVELAEPGRLDPGDQLTWNQASIDGGGPLGTCKKLGITW